VRLKAQPQSVSAARHFVASNLADRGQDSLVDSVVLLTSEVVTNAVLHGGPYGDDGDVVLWLDSTGTTVRVEVRDRSLARPIVGDALGTGRPGRGMYLVDRLASAWGVTADASGKWVWFEVHA